MASPFMEAYSKRVIEICHKRNVHAIGGMAAQIPVKDNYEANSIAFEKVRNDKKREVKNGHDGTWVAHPALVSVAKDIFDQYMPSQNQIDKKFDYQIKAADLLEIPKGEVTEKGIRKNINVGILYLESWLTGTGAAAIYNLMEDAATAEISRAQLWQWLHTGAKLADGRVITAALYDHLLNEELTKIQSEIGADRYTRGHFIKAISLFMQMVKTPHLDEFLTLPAYEMLG
jgi:malate synthase